MAYAPLLPKRARTLGFMRWVDELQEQQTFVTASVEAPGRLGTMLAGAAVSLLPPDGNRPTSREFRILLLDEEFATIDALALSTSYVARTSTLSHSDAGRQEITGTETKLVDDSGELSLVMVEHHQQERIGIKFHAHAPVNKPLKDVLPALEFLALMKYAKSCVVYPRWAAIPYHEAVDITELSPKFHVAVKSWYDLAESMKEISPATEPALRFPNLAAPQRSWLNIDTLPPVKNR
ncbi:MAG: hypothetical protein HLX46_11590 [Corynebacterium sp.]|uniref:hypothetical protein n=1 Tax=Corynebacterium sp. TaxID=1720 RepID=UPI001834EABD|nr:hypothetical protein [Corynebacterium sp.]NWO17445.1 hypothetical protein [Corynebacterium sp.]